MGKTMDFDCDSLRCRSYAIFPGASLLDPSVTNLIYSFCAVELLVSYVTKLSFQRRNILPGEYFPENSWGWKFLDFGRIIWWRPSCETQIQLDFQMNLDFPDNFGNRKNVSDEMCRHDLASTRILESSLSKQFY